MNEGIPAPDVNGTELPAVPRVSWWRRHQGCILGLIVGASAVACLLLVGFILLVQRGVSEIAEMAPWPGPEVPAQQVATANLTGLGLEADPVQNARDDPSWADGGYTDGALITYSADGNRIVTVWALKYADESTALADFGSVQGWAATPGNCAWQTYAYLGYSGLIQCRESHAHQKLFWNGRWIVHVQALEGTGNSPDVLVDLVRDALAAHWKANAKAASK